MSRALVVSSSPLLRATLESLVDVVGVVPAIEDAANLAEQFDPDLIIVEWDHDGAQDLIELAAEPVPVLVLAADGQPPWTNDTLRAGVRGIVARDSPADELAAAIEAVAAGLVVLHPQSREDAALRTDVAEALSPREIEVLRLMAEGSSNKEIAWRLNISEHTVKFHVNSILSKMNAGSRTEAVMLGLRRGLIPL